MSDVVLTNLALNDKIMTKMFYANQGLCTHCTQSFLILNSNNNKTKHSNIHLKHIIKTSFQNSLRCGTCAFTQTSVKIINNLFTLKELTFCSIDVGIVQRFEAVVALGQMHVLLGTDIGFSKPVMRSSPGDQAVDEGN